MINTDTDLENVLKEAKNEKMQFKDFVKSSLKTAMLILLSFGFGVFLKAFIIFTAVVPSSSMMPTLEVNDCLFGSRVAYWFGDVKRGDIIVFDAPDNPGTKYVKRVVGLPGDNIEIIDGIVYLNGNIYLNDVEFDKLEYDDFELVIVPEDSYFVLGDNRNNSLDSRYWKTTHFVTKDSIDGKVVYKLTPTFSKIN